MVEAQRAREQREDFYTARIVAMVAAVNTKRGRYDPVKYMINGRELTRERAERAAARAPLTGEEILDRMRVLGVPIIDKRTKVAARLDCTIQSTNGQ